MNRILSICLVICVVCSVCVTCASATNFVDVAANDWYYNDVDYVYENKLMNGIGDGKFKPAGTMTRAMIVTVLYRLSGATEVITPSKFLDVKSGSYYEKAVAWATATGIVNGYSETVFAPNDAVTREQVATVLYRYATSCGYDTSTLADITLYSDYDKIGRYALTALQWTNEIGLITGTSTTTLAPKSNATRAQIAAILHRFCKWMTQSESNSTTHTVTFLLNYDGAVEYKVLTVKNGNTIQEPDKPTREYYNFQAWYTQADSGEVFDFSTPITMDTTLYAHWESIKQPPIEELPEYNSHNVFLLAREYDEAQKTISVTLLLCGKVDLCGFDMELSYDDEKISLRELNTKCDLSLIASAKEGNVSFNYVGVTNITSSKMILTAVFDIVAENGANANITLIPVDVIKTDTMNSYAIINADYSLEYFCSTRSLSSAIDSSYY